MNIPHYFSKIVLRDFKSAIEAFLLEIPFHRIQTIRAFVDMNTALHLFCAKQNRDQARQILSASASASIKPSDLELITAVLRSRVLHMYSQTNALRKIGRERKKLRAI